MSYLFPYGYRKSVPYNGPTHLNNKLQLENNRRRLKVSGEGIVQVEPDIAIVSLGVQTQGMELSKAQQENSEMISNIINTLENMGVSSQDIKTQSYNIFPRYDYIEGQQIFRGYTVEHMLTVVIRDIDKTGEIIDQAVKSGSNVINSITFSVADPSGYYKKALSKAIDDALGKAIFIGRDLNVEVSTIPMEVVELSSKPTPYGMTLSKADIATPIQPGQIDISARIEATYNY